MNLRNLFSKEKDLKMVWKIERDGKWSYLVGTAHFFPYSFKRYLIRYISSVDTVLLEGPLDESSMSRVLDRGLEEEVVPHLYDALDKETIIQINRELASPLSGLSSFTSYVGIFRPKTNDLFYSLAARSKPWMVFFTIWFHYLEKRGWKYKMDVDAFTIAKQLGKDVYFLEDIEEQLEALAGIPLERIVHFLKGIKHWSKRARAYTKCYLDGNLEKLMHLSREFPSRCESIIDRRDRILYERMKGFFERGTTIAFVGAPHTREIKRMFLEDGYKLA